MRKRNILELIFVTVCLGIMFFLLVSSINSDSPTYDEVTNTESGYQFLVNKDFRFDPFNPPFAREIIALPALIQKNVIYNRVIFWPRMMVVLFTLALGVLVYIFSKKLFGGLAAKLALIIFVFEPNTLSNGHYATKDLIFTFFFLLSLFYFWLWKDKFTYKRVIIFSIIIGLSLSTKLTAIPFILFPLLVLFLMEIKNRWKMIKSFFSKKKIWIILSFIFITTLTLWSTYFFKLEPPLGYRFDENRPAIKLAKSNPLIKIALTVPIPLGSYVSTIKELFMFNYTNLYIKRSYFPGDVSIDGSPGYLFPLAVLIKTPIPLLMLFFLSILFFYKNSKNGKYLLVPLFLIFFTVIFSKTILVIRYILPIYPLIIIYSSQVINIKIAKRNLLYIFLGLMMVWYIVGTLNSFPYFTSYMNETVGGAKDRYKYLADSNYDWGQGLIALKDYQDKNNITNLQFAYFGSVNPANYGIKYERINSLSINDNKKVESLKFDNYHTIAIGATCWYFCGYYENPAFNGHNPVTIVGGSILIFKKNRN